MESNVNKEGEQKLTTQRLNDMASAFKQAGTLLGAIELNLFTVVAEAGGQAEPTEIAEKIDVTVENTERLMIACAALSLIEKKGDKYVNAPDVDKYLVRGKPTFFGDYLVYDNKSGYDAWKNIASQLRPPIRTYYAMARDPQAARAFTVAGYNASISAGHKLAKEFDFSPYSLLLDLGGGSGCYSIAAASRYPHLRAIVFDQPNVVMVAEEFIAQAGLSHRVTTHAGDFFDDEFPRGADLVAYITPLQSYEADEVQFLIQKAYDAVEPGGGIIIIDYMLDDDKTGPLDPAFYHLSAGFSQTNPGRVNSGAEFTKYLEKAGFINVEVSNFLPGVLGRVTARKPK